MVSDHIDQLIDSLGCANLLQNEIVEQNQACVDEVFDDLDALSILANLLPIQKDVECEILGLGADLGHDFLAYSLDIWNGQQSNRLVDIGQILIFDDVLQRLH